MSDALEPLRKYRDGRCGMREENKMNAPAEPRGPLVEAPPVTLNPSGIWSRACPHCSHYVRTILGPNITGQHLCKRDGVVYLVQWAPVGTVTG